MTCTYFHKGSFFYRQFFFCFLQKKSYLVTYSVYVQYDDYYSTFVNGKKTFTCQYCDIQ